MSFEILVLGGGPAGLSAALNAHARGRSALVVSNPPEENPLWKAGRVDNYPGLPGVSGRALLSAMRRQAEEAGVEFVTGRVLSALPMMGSWFISVGQEMYNARAVVLATGVARGILEKADTAVFLLIFPDDRCGAVGGCIVHADNLQVLYILSQYAVQAGI